MTRSTQTHTTSCSPDISIWLSVDPMAHKFPGWSPYAYTFNNPINFIDPDGNEGVALIDHKNQSITIRADYFVGVGKNGFNIDNYNQLNNINTTLNSQEYSVKDQNNITNGYAVKFELNFIPVRSDQDAINFAESEYQLVENKLNGKNDLVIGGFSIGNSIVLTDDVSFENMSSIIETAAKYNVATSNILGITSSSLQHIKIPEKSRGNKLTALHEILHTLYLNQDDATSGIGTGRELPNQSDINILIKGFQENKRIIE